MCPGSSAQISKLRVNRGLGNQQAWDALIPLIYGELRRVARRHLGHERRD